MAPDADDELVEEAATALDHVEVAERGGVERAWVDHVMHAPPIGPERSAAPFRPEMARGAQSALG